MSASEMLCLVRHFPIFGYFVEQEDPVWELLLQLDQLVEMLVYSHHDVHFASILKDKVTEYLELLDSLFPDSLKPKHHFLLHYLRILSVSGPHVDQWDMRYESKNREGKIISHVAIYRINVCRTIIIKNELKLNHRLLQNKSVSLYFSENDIEEVSVTSFPDFSFYQHLVLPNFQNFEHVKILKKSMF